MYRKVFLWFAGIVVVFGTVVGLELAHFDSFSSAPSAPAPIYSLTLDGATVHVTLARTPAEQERGLGGRDSLAPDEGMLFVFPRDGQYAFWMKDMKFPIDIIWLAAYGSVVYVVPDLSPSTYPHSFGPKTPARFVLEVPAGFAVAHHVGVGDVAQLP